MRTISIAYCVLLLPHALLDHAVAATTNLMFCQVAILGEPCWLASSNANSIIGRVMEHSTVIPRATARLVVMNDFSARCHRRHGGY